MNALAPWRWLTADPNHVATAVIVTAVVVFVACTVAWGREQRATPTDRGTLQAVRDGEPDTPFEDYRDAEMAEFEAEFVEGEV